ncbi:MULTISPECIES: aldo/keto reductase [unclassified Janibacter]|uniref:aldo/keto reductase n=1 Tax=unclassified Janibacter TaxID=2649294 RepID=UPI003D053A40
MSTSFSKQFKGVDVPTFGIGTWQVEGQDATDAVRDALEIGYRHVDTAFIYGNEEQVGRGMAESGVDRGDYWLTTKVWPDDYAAGATRASVERSLRDLGTDHLDLVLTHWPAGDGSLLPGALEELRQAKADGLIREFGVSNVPAGMLRRLLVHFPEIFADQVEYHPLLAQTALLEVAAEHDLMVTAYSPLSSGGQVLTDPTVVEIAQAKGVTPAQVALAWLGQQEKVTVLPRSTSPERRRENWAATDVTLTHEESQRLFAGTVAHVRNTSPDGLAPTDWED